MKGKDRFFNYKIQDYNNAVILNWGKDKTFVSCVSLYRKCSLYNLDFMSGYSRAGNYKSLSPQIHISKTFASGGIFRTENRFPELVKLRTWEICSIGKNTTLTFHPFRTWKNHQFEPGEIDFFPRGLLLKCSEYRMVDKITNPSVIKCVCQVIPAVSGVVAKISLCIPNSCICLLSITVLQSGSFSWK